MSVSVASNKLIGIQELVHAMLQRQPVTVHQVMYFWGKITICTSRHVELPSCAMLFSMTCWMFNTLPLISFFHSFFFLFQSCISFRDCLSCIRIWYPLWFPPPVVVIATNVQPHHWAFTSSVVAPGLVLDARCILPCKNSQTVAPVLHKMAF